MCVLGGGAGIEGDSKLEWTSALVSYSLDIWLAIQWPILQKKRSCNWKPTASFPYRHRLLHSSNFWHLRSSLLSSIFKRIQHSSSNKDRKTKADVEQGAISIPCLAAGSRRRNVRKHHSSHWTSSHHSSIAWCPGRWHYSSHSPANSSFHKHILQVRD